MEQSRLRSDAGDPPCRFAWVPIPWFVHKGGGWPFRAVPPRRGLRPAPAQRVSFKCKQRVRACQVSLEGHVFYLSKAPQPGS